MAARKFWLLVLFLISALIVSAQETESAIKEKQEREQKLLEQILSDAKQLRLPENRAFVESRLGDALWESDNARARKLFEAAINDLTEAQTSASAEKNGKQYFLPLIYGAQPRLDIVNLLANRDADLALRYLLKSRPETIAAALQNPATADESSQLQQFARQEFNAEQRIYALAAAQDPQLAARRVRENLGKNVSNETINILKKIFEKDAALADKLAAEVAESYFAVDFSKNYQASDAVGYFVAETGKKREANEKGVSIPEDLLRRLVAKMIDDWLGGKDNQTFGYWSCQAVVERLFPERVPLIKKRIEQINTRYQNAESREYTRLMQQETSAEEMIARAEKLPAGYRNEIYRAAAMKIAQAGNIGQAEKIMLSSSGDEQSEYYLANFYANLSYQLIGQGKFDEANDYINRIENDEQRIGALINLANSVYQRNPQENQKKAEEILAQARVLLSNAPETNSELNSAANLAAAYAAFDPDESFQILESMLPVLNELIQANFVLMKFRSYGGVRQGEMQLMNGNGSGVYSLENILRSLKAKDFDRVLRFTNGFDRLETRVLLQMQLIDENLTGGLSLPLNSRRAFVLN